MWVLFWCDGEITDTQQLCRAFLATRGNAWIWKNLKRFSEQKQERSLKPRKLEWYNKIRFKMFIKVKTFWKVLKHIDSMGGQERGKVNPRDLCEDLLKIDRGESAKLKKLSRSVAMIARMNFWALECHTLIQRRPYIENCCCWWYFNWLWPKMLTIFSKIS